MIRTRWPLVRLLALLLTLGIAGSGAARALAVPPSLALANTSIPRSHSSDPNAQLGAGRLSPSTLPAALQARSTPRATLPAFSHIFTILMENHEYSSIIGNTSAPYINSLASQYGLATQYYAITHPSLPNYLNLTGGSAYGITTDCNPTDAGCHIAGSNTNIADQIEASGRTWRAYMESMPAACTLSNAYPYAVRHNPFVYYDDIQTNSTRCTSDVVTYTQFATDLASPSLPNYIWITPNVQDDMHDGTISAGDTWLQQNVPAILASSAFQNGGVLFITWDEGSTNAGCCSVAAGGQVATLVISPLAMSGYESTTPEDHYSLLRTVEDSWGLTPPLNNAAGASAMSEYFYTPCTGATMSAIPASPQPAGTSITFSANAGSCPSPRYEFWALPPGGSWVDVQPYSATNTWTWNTPANAQPGTYLFTVWVRDAGSSAAYDTYAPIQSYSLTAPPVCTGATLTASPLSPQSPGTNVTFTAFANGPNCQYEFWALPIGGSWVEVQPYSTTTSWAWDTPASAAQGTYQFAVWVKAAASAAPYDDYAIIFDNLGCVVNLTASPASPQPTGTTVTFTAMVAGVCASPQYQWWGLPPGGSWTVAEAYPGTASLTVATSGIPTGTWYVAVWVKQAGSPAAYDTYALIPYTFTSGSSAGRTAGSSAPLPPAPAANTPRRVPGPGFPRILPSATR